MSRSPNVEIDRSILHWARKSSGIDVATAAKRAGTTPARIEEWEEEGGSYPTIKQLRKLAKAYMRPIGLFFLPELPEDPESIKDFRKIPDEFKEEMSSALRFEIRLAWDRREEALEMIADLDEEPTIIHDRLIATQTRLRSRYEKCSVYQLLNKCNGEQSTMHSMHGGRRLNKKEPSYFKLASCAILSSIQKKHVVSQ